MATKWTDLRHRLPSANELLEVPPLKSLAVRWNRSVVAAGVRSFVDELRADLERRRAGGRFPSLQELAARAAQHVARLQQAPLRPAINATGRVFEPSCPVRPLADAALERMVGLAGGYAHLEPRRGPDAAALVARLTKADAATFVESYAGAVWLALATFAAGREVVIARGEVGEVEAGCALASLATSAAAQLKEAGSVNRATAVEYESAASERTAAILRLSAEDYHVAGRTVDAELESLVGLARDRELVLIHALGSGALIDGLPGIGDWLPSVAASIAAGVHFAIVRGDGLVGGPRCGIVVGRRDAIRRIEGHPMFTAWRANDMSVAALAATLELYDDPEWLQQTVPLFQLLTAPVENLRHRAERLAPQLAQAADVVAAEPIATQAELGVACCDARIASYGVALKPVDENVNVLQRRLRTAPVPVLGRLEEDRLVLDLRTVFPRQDARLAELVAGSETAAQCDQPAQQADGV